MIVQGQWLQRSDLLTIPHVTNASLPTIANIIRSKLQFTKYNVPTLFTLRMMSSKKKFKIEDIFSQVFPEKSAIEASNFIHNIPIVKISVKLAGKTLALNSDQVSDVDADTEIDVEVDLRKIAPNDMSVKSKKFSKQKDESWLVLIGIPVDDELAAMKRVTIRKTTTASLKITTPKGKGIVFRHTLFVYSRAQL